MGQACEFQVTAGGAAAAVPLGLLSVLVAMRLLFSSSATAQVFPLGLSSV